MGLLDFLFKRKEERRKEKRVKDVLKRTDDFIERTERMLDEMQKKNNNKVTKVVLGLSLI